MRGHWREALERNDDVTGALAEFDRKRRRAMDWYQRASRWTTPMFQSQSRALAAVRDRTFYPLSRLPFVRSRMLRTLSGQDKEFSAATGSESRRSSSCERH